MTSNSLRSWRYGERKIKFWEPPETSGEAARNTLSPSPHSPRGFAAFFISRMLTIPPATQARRRINTTNYKSVSEATNMAEQLRDFAQFNGHQELSLVLSKVIDILSNIKLPNNRH